MVNVALLKDSIIKNLTQVLLLDKTDILKTLDSIGRCSFEAGDVLVTWLTDELNYMFSAATTNMLCFKDVAELAYVNRTFGDAFFMGIPVDLKLSNNTLYPASIAYHTDTLFNGLYINFNYDMSYVYVIDSEYLHQVVESNKEKYLYYDKKTGNYYVPGKFMEQFVDNEHALCVCLPF